MHLHKSTEYSIRCLIYIARSDRDLVSVARLATKLDLPYKFLTRLMSNLRKANIVESVRGKNGGFRIIRPLKEIFLLEILAATEGVKDFKRCLLGLSTCGDGSPCAMHKYWAQPRHHLFKMVQSVSLADLLDEKIVKL